NRGKGQGERRRRGRMPRRWRCRAVELALVRPHVLARQDIVVKLRSAADRTMIESARRGDHLWKCLTPSKESTYFSRHCMHRHSSVVKSSKGACGGTSIFTKAVHRIGAMRFAHAAF